MQSMKRFIKQTRGAGPLASPVTWLFLIAVVGILFASGTLKVPSFGGGTLAAQPTSNTVVNAPTINVPAEDTTITLSATDKYDSSISIKGNHQYRTRQPGEADWSTWSAVADAGTATVGSLANVQVAFGYANMSAGTIRAYAQVAEFQLRGEGAKTLSSKTMIRNGTVTIRAFNEEGQLVAEQTNETLGAGDVVSLSGDIQGQFERGAPYGGVLVYEHNSTVFDFDGMVLSVDGVSKKVNVPTFYTLASTVAKARAFDVPPLTSTTKRQLTVNIDVDDTIGPNQGENLLITFYPREYFLNTQTDEYELGVEDENGNALNKGATVFTLYTD